MKVGTLAYATSQGLGILAKSFIDNGVVTDILVVEHYNRPANDWYPDAPVTPMAPLNMDLARDFVKSMDAMLFFETPFSWDLIPYCRDNGVRTVLMPMYECMPRTLPYCPDSYICPSLLDLRHYPLNSTFIPVPVQVPWQQRHKARTYVHNGGHLGLRGRNGTLELLQAMKYVQSPLRLLVRGQCGSFPGLVSQVPEIASDERVSIIRGTLPYDELWNTGDVFVFPEKFNGLSLALQEARAAGMLVMGTHRYPMTTWLPNEALIPVLGTHRACVSGRCIEFDEAVIDPEDIAATMDKWYDQDISSQSLAGKHWAEDMSWESLGPQYLEYIIG